MGAVLAGLFHHHRFFADSLPVRWIFPAHLGIPGRRQPVVTNGALVA